jgi:hypothetical protein
MQLNKLYYPIICGLLLFCHLLTAQEIIKNKTLGIIDTSETKLEQSKEIYNWITSNIRYDVKAYLKGNTSNKSAIETLKRRKGICYDYSLLYREMCGSVNIESYLVVGYSKGAEFYKGSGFYRADHCWNAVKIDSSWFLVDATWGSGYLERTASWWDKLKNTIFKTPYIKNRLKFIQDTTEKYFNISNDSLKQTHMPLDPKWQLTRTPYSIMSFESDSTTQRSSLPYYQEQLRNAHNLSDEQQIFEEGLNGKEFNSKNNFNISAGYLVRANEFDYNATITDSFRLQQCKENLGYYIRSKEFISLYKSSMDSIFTTRLNFIKKNLKDAKILRKKIYQDYKSNKKSFKKNQRSLSNRYSNLLNRIEQYEGKIELLQADSIYEFDKFKRTTNDTSGFESNILRLISSIRKCENLKFELDTAFERCLLLILSDSVLTIKISGENKLFFFKIGDLLKTLSKEDNLAISQSWIALYKSYNSTIESLKSKALKFKVIQNEYANFILNTSLLVSRYQNQIELMIAYYGYSGDSARSITMIQITRENLIDMNIKAKELSFAYREIYRNLYNLNNKQILITGEINTLARNNIQLFEKYEEMLLDKEELEYKNEKGFVRDITSKANTGIQLLTKKIDKFYSLKGTLAHKNRS